MYTRNVVILGPPDVGKTHFAVSLGVKAVEAGYSVLFLTLESLLSRLTRSRTENHLERALRQFSYPKLSVVGLKFHSERRPKFHRAPSAKVSFAPAAGGEGDSGTHWGRLA